MRVVALWIAGCSSAFHIGKIPAALPTLSSDLQLSLFGSGSIVSLFSVLVAISGSLIGLFASKLNYRNAALLGLLLASSASIAGTYTSTYLALVFTRSLEGLGWILVAVSVPMLMIAVSEARHRPFVLGLWGAFFPAGASFALWVSPWILATSDWRTLWLYAGLGSGLGALLIYAATMHPAATPQIQRTSSKNKFASSWKLPVTQIVSQPAIGCLLVCFFVYSAQFASITAFLPILLLENPDVTMHQAAMLGALVMLSNVIGSVFSGILLSMGFPRQHIIVFALCVMLVLTIAVFSEQTSPLVKVTAAAGFSAVSGLIPGTLFAAAPQMVSQMSMVGIVNGLLLQAAGLGQFFGPLILTGMVELQGSWSVGMVFTALACVIGILSMRVFTRVYSK